MKLEERTFGTPDGGDRGRLETTIASARETR